MLSIYRRHVKEIRTRLGPKQQREESGEGARYSYYAHFVSSRVLLLRRSVFSSSGA